MARYLASSGVLESPNEAHVLDIEPGKPMLCARQSDIAMLATKRKSRRETRSRSLFRAVAIFDPCITVLSLQRGVAAAEYGLRTGFAPIAQPREL